MATIRQQIIDLLSDGPCDARDISQTLGIREKEVYDHLDHIAKSVSAQNRKLKVRPPVCLSCGYEFRDRKRLTKPGRCPECRQQRIQSPVYQVV